MSAKETKKNISTYGNLAYDLDALAREIGREPKEEVVSKPPRTTKKIRNAPAPKVNLRANVRVCGIVTIALVAVLFVGLIRSTEMSTEIDTISSEISALETEYAVLRSEHEKAFDMNRIKSTAEAAGLTQPSSAQTEYIDISVGDSAVVYTGKDRNMLKTMFSSVSGGIFSFFEFFS